MRIYVFGNPDFEGDNQVYNIVKIIKKKFPVLEFVEIIPGEDFPLSDKGCITLIDTVEGLDKVEVLDENKIDKLVLIKSVSVHDWDLGFQLKYLKKLGKLKKIRIIGIPKHKNIDYLRIHSILRKLVEQDIQGS